MSAIRRLENVGALNKDGNLTPLGHHLAALPVDVRIGKINKYNTHKNHFFEELCLQNVI